MLRPVDPARFGGTVVVSWQNVTVGFEMGTPVLDVAAAGVAWVGVTAQRVAVDGFPSTAHVALRGWDPERYGSLAHPGDDFSFDIFAQAGRAVGPDRLAQAGAGGGPDPMDGLPVERLLATGTSQSALRLRAYVDAVHPLEPVFDGFLLTLDIGSGALVDSRDQDTSQALRIPSAQARIRADLDVPVLVVNSETEVERLAPVRQPEPERFVLWEIAGVPHVDNSAAAVEHTARELTRLGVDPALYPRVDEPDSNGCRTPRSSGRRSATCSAGSPRRCRRRASRWWSSTRACSRQRSAVTPTATRSGGSACPTSRSRWRSTWVCATTPPTS